MKHLHFLTRFQHEAVKLSQLSQQMLLMAFLAFHVTLVASSLNAVFSPEQTR